MTRPILCACGKVMAVGNGCCITKWESGHKRLPNTIGQCPDCNVAGGQYHHIDCTVKLCCIHPDQWSADCYKCEEAAMAATEAEFAKCFREKGMSRSAVSYPAQRWLRALALRAVISPQAQRNFFERVPPLGLPPLVLRAALAALRLADSSVSIFFGI